MSASNREKYAHNKSVHGFVSGKPPDDNETLHRNKHEAMAESNGVPESPLDKVKFHKQGIRTAMREIDDERTRLMIRIKEIDDLMASWKVFTGQV